MGTDPRGEGHRRTARVVGEGETKAVRGGYHRHHKSGQE